MPVGDAQPPGPDPLIGRVLSDRYRIQRKLGEGGMGVVYQAEHALIEKKIALKILFPELTRRTELVARFLQEAKSASRIAHENVIDISDFGQSPDGLVYIAMEYLDGVDLGHVLRNGGPMPWQRARAILMQIGKALRAAHDHGIIHRDMKPENIFLIQRDGHPDFVKVLDFGIAKVVNLDEDGPRLTQTGMIFGTPEYMSPEQAQGQTPDYRVDIYAVGCIMYHLLTGQVPFTADSFMGILTKHMLEPVIPPRQRRPDLDIPEDIEAVVMRAVQKERNARWEDMNAFCRALAACGGEVYDFSGPHSGRINLKVADPVSPSAAHVAPQPLAELPPRPTSTEILPLPDTQEMLAQAGARTGRSNLVAGLVVAGIVVIAAVAGIAAFRSSASSTEAARSGAPAAAPAGSAAARSPPPTTEPPATSAASSPEAPVHPAAAAASTSSKPTTRTRQRSSADAVRALTGEPGKAERQRTATPAELKDPFNSQQ
jgi:serine/threonine-protein kinase